MPTAVDKTTALPSIYDTTKIPRVLVYNAG